MRRRVARCASILSLRYARSDVMRWTRSFARRLIAPFTRRGSELSAELDAHISAHIDDNIRLGMAEDEARRRALVALGGLAQTKETVRDRHSLPFVEKT